MSRALEAASEHPATVRCVVDIRALTKTYAIGDIDVPALRGVLVEVHFLKLEKRGRATAPIRIEKLLGGKGFKTRWVDASHLFATRN